MTQQQQLQSQPRVPHHRYPTGAELGIPGDTAEIRVFYPKIPIPESNDSRTEVKPVLGHCFGVGEQGWWDGGLQGYIPLLGIPTGITLSSRHGALPVSH